MESRLSISPDAVIYGRFGPFTLNATVVFTWVVMAILVIGSWLITRNLSTSPRISRWQNMLEIVVSYIRSQIGEITRQNPDPYISFLGTLFLFIVASNLLAIVPGFHPPTGSLNTTAALALAVFFAVPIFGIASRGVVGYLREYARPSFFMLPFNIIGEFSRTIALAVRLFGNMMSGTLIGALLLAFVPLFVPVAMNLFALLIGVIQAYIFAVLATVYIGSATRTRQQEEQEHAEEEREERIREAGSGERREREAVGGRDLRPGEAPGDDRKPPGEVPGRTERAELEKPEHEEAHERK